MDIVKQIDDPAYSAFKADKEMIEKAKYEQRKIRKDKIANLYTEIASGGKPGSRNKKRGSTNDFAKEVRFVVLQEDQIS